MRVSCGPKLVLGLILTVSTPVLASESTPLTLQAVRQMALADSPRLAQIRARYAAASELPAQVGALPDPTLNFALLGLAADSFDFDQEAMTQLQVGFTQPVPWPGKRELAASAASFRAEATAAELTEAQNQLVRDVTRTWWSVFYLDQALQLTDENLTQLRAFNRIAQSRYRVGNGSQQDVLRAQLELSNQLERQLVLQAQRRSLAIQLNVLLARPAERLMEIVAPDDLSLPQLPALQQLVDTGLQQRPGARQQQLLLQAAQEQRQLARKGRLPDITLGAAYGYREDAPGGASRADLLSFTLGIKLPLYATTKQDSEVRQRAAEFDAQKQALLDTELKIRSEVVQAVSDYDRASAQSELLEQGIILQARQNLASIQAGYQVGKVDFAALIQAQLTVNRARLQYWQAQRDAQQALADLTAALGGAIHE